MQVETTYFIVKTRKTRLSRFISSISTMSGMKLFAFPFQRVDTTLQVDIQMGIVVDGQRILHGKKLLLSIQRISSFTRHLPKRCKIDKRLVEIAFVVQCAIYAITSAKT